MTDLYSHILQQKEQGKKMLSVLIDPDKTDREGCIRLLELAGEHLPDFFMVGGSLMTRDRLEEVVLTLKEQSNVPIILFPGNYAHLTDLADALLFLSLISGRNAEYLIGQQVVAAPLLQRMPLEIMPTGYMLVDCGKPTTVSYISNTSPIPYNKPEIAACTALAGEMLGLKLIYADGGSGAARPVAPEMVAALRQSLSIPLIVGGGIRTLEAAQNAYRAGADMLVIGTAIEESPDFMAAVSRLKSEMVNEASF